MFSLSFGFGLDFPPSIIIRMLESEYIETAIDKTTTIVLFARCTNCLGTAAVFFHLKNTKMFHNEPNKYESTLSNVKELTLILMMSAFNIMECEESKCRVFLPENGHPKVFGLFGGYEPEH